MVAFNKEQLSYLASIESNQMYLVRTYYGQEAYNPYCDS